jgi:CRP-like cAMP-binding protein
VSKTVVAALVGVKKETLSRLLRDLSERRLIEVSRRDITILDREQLAGIK